jgi:hypothetical protein
MKKFLSILFAFCILFLNADTLFAQGDNSDPVTFFESTENLMGLKSYKAKQGISGGFKIGSNMSGMEESAVGNYRLVFTSDIYNQDDLKRDFRTLMNGHLNINLKGDGRPFDNLLLNFRAEFILVNGDGLYARLDNVVLNAKGVPADEMNDYMEFKKELNDEVSKIRSQWIFIPIEEYEELYSEELPEEYSSFADKEGFIKSMKDNGLKKTLETYLDDIIELMKDEGMLTDEDAVTFKKIANEFLKTKFFSQKTVTRGASKGYVSFRLDRTNLFGFFKKVAEIADETLSATDLNMLREYLNKFIISGAYHTDYKYRIFDDFRIRGTIRDIGPLHHLQTTLAYKVSDINKVKTIKAPSSFKHIDELDVPILPPTTGSDLTSKALQVLVN